MTFIELCLTIGIASILFSLALFLAQHVNTITKIRRAQAELAQWHTAIDDWFVQFGEYPAFDMSVIDAERKDVCVCGIGEDYEITMNLSNALDRVCVRITLDEDPIFFRSFVVGSPSMTDPWGMYYIYIPEDENSKDTVVNPRTTYRLFSCGPDGKSYILADSDIMIKINDGNEGTIQDDVYFGN